MVLVLVVGLSELFCFLHLMREQQPSMSRKSPLMRALAIQYNSLENYSRLFDFLDLNLVVSYDLIDLLDKDELLYMLDKKN